MRRVVRGVARQYAARRVADLRTKPIEIFGQPVRFLDTGDGERFAAHAVAHLISLGMIESEQAREFARRGDPLFQHALGLLGMAERPRKLQHGRKRETNYFRDIVIVMLVQELQEGFEIKPTSSAKDGQEGCGCGIVAAEMGMTYDAACAVWKRLGKAI